MCVCVCTRTRARVSVCVCVCTRLRATKGFCCCFVLKVIAVLCDAQAAAAAAKRLPSARTRDGSGKMSHVILSPETFICCAECAYFFVLFVVVVGCFALLLKRCGGCASKTLGVGYRSARHAWHCPGEGAGGGMVAVVICDYVLCTHHGSSSLTTGTGGNQTT